ncbi:hypothetical protein [Capnocytophaga canis]|uniref:hypothetical protein n=1 Tax=Capnocytophaga canis TaxID=1848903 RepID=UPI0015621B13|nr:hypothetical protein [Capnocytophaga canis]
MKKRGIFILVFLLNFVWVGCLKNEAEDVETIVELTIYPQTQSGKHVLSDIWTEAIVYSDNEDNRKQDAFHTIIEGKDKLSYERGFQYTFKAKKTWMKKNPPQDVIPIKYELLELLKKEKIITQDTSEEIELAVNPQKVKFYKSYPIELDANGKPVLYDALFCLDNQTKKPVILQEIKNFEFETGYHYLLKVNKLTKATPFSVSYELIEIKSKKLP